jgi:hypothetical protein
MILENPAKSRRSAIVVIAIRQGDSRKMSTVLIPITLTNLQGPT